MQLGLPKPRRPSDRLLRGLPLSKLDVLLPRSALLLLGKHRLLRKNAPPLLQLQEPRLLQQLLPLQRMMQRAILVITQILKCHRKVQLEPMLWCTRLPS